MSARVRWLQTGSTLSFTMSRFGPAVPTVGLKLFTNAYELVDHVGTIPAGRLLRRSGTRVQGGSGLVLGPGADLVEHTAGDFQRPAELGHRERSGLGRIVVDDVRAYPRCQRIRHDTNITDHLCECVHDGMRHGVSNVMRSCVHDVLRQDIQSSEIGSRRCGEVQCPRCCEVTHRFAPRLLPNSAS